MASVNKVIIIGNLGRDPETRAFPSGDQICNIRVATTDKWKDKQTGESRDHTEWHSIVFNGRLAEIASQYLRKGSQVYVEGSLRTRKWQDQNGNDRYSTEIRADSMKMLGSRQGMGGDDSYGNSGYGGGGNSAAFKPSANRGEPPASGGFAAAPNQGGGFEGGNGGAGFVAPTPAAPPRQQAPAYAPAPAERPGSGFGEMDDDIPF